MSYQLKILARPLLGGYIYGIITQHKPQKKRPVATGRLILNLVLDLEDISQTKLHAPSSREAARILERSNW